MMKTKVANFVLFQLGWFACVYSAAVGQPVLGAVVAIGIVAWHLGRANEIKAEIKLIAIAVAIGLVWDSLLVVSGLLIYSSGLFLPVMAPYWIVIMWALFATTLNVSMSWLKGRWLLALVFGAIGGPLAYFAGHRLGAVEFSNTLYAMFALMVGWGIFTPLLAAMSQRFDGYSLVGEKP